MDALDYNQVALKRVRFRNYAGSVGRSPEADLLEDPLKTERPSKVMATNIV